MKCLVTGATGFIGSRLVPHLADHGHEVLAFSRSGGPLQDGTPTVALDLARTAISSEALCEVDVVVHLAGIAHQQASGDAYRTAVVESTQDLATQAAAAGVGHFIYFSSVKAMGALATSRVRSEHDCSDVLTPYGSAKRAAETALLRGDSTAAMSVSVVRPALVYGVSAKGNLALLERAARAGFPRPPELGARSMVSLDALLDLVASLVANPPDGCNAWIACDDEPYSTAQVYDLLRNAMGLSARTSWLPLWLWRAGLGVMDVALRRRQDATFEKLFGTEVYSNRALCAATGWEPGCRLEAWAARVGAGA